MALECLVLCDKRKPHRSGAVHYSPNVHFLPRPLLPPSITPYSLPGRTFLDSRTPVTIPTPSSNAPPRSVDFQARINHQLPPHWLRPRARILRACAGRFFFRLCREPQKKAPPERGSEGRSRALLEGRAARLSPCAYEGEPRTGRLTKHGHPAAGY